MAGLRTKLDTLLGDTLGYDVKSLIAHMEANTQNSFMNSLLMQFRKKGDLSQRQWEVLNENFNRAKENRIKKEEGEKNAPQIDLSRIKEMFDTAKQNGLEYPKLRVEDVIISLAPATGANAGALYVKKKVNGENAYAGKLKDGKWFPVRDFANDENLVKLLQEIAKDPQKVAAMHGHKTGKCSMCGRKLTDKKSVELGIGPICIQNWGI